MATPARRCAYTVTRRVFEGGAYTDHAFRAEARRLELDGRDRAFAMRLAYGVVQRRALTRGPAQHRVHEAVSATARRPGEVDRLRHRRVIRDAVHVEQLVRAQP